MAPVRFFCDFGVLSLVYQAAAYDEKMREAHSRAAKCILLTKNRSRSDDTVDLHGIHPQEVCAVLDQLIEAKRKGAFCVKYPGI